MLVCFLMRERKKGVDLGGSGGGGNWEGKGNRMFYKNMIFSKNKIEKENGSAWWHRTAIPALERLMQEDCGFEAEYE